MLAKGGWQQWGKTHRLFLYEEKECPVVLQPEHLPQTAELGSLWEDGAGYVHIKIGSWKDYKRVYKPKDKGEPENSRGYHKTQKIGAAPERMALHRLVCWLAYGDPPSPKHECLHSCEHKKSCRPACLRWGTHKENMATVRPKRPK